LRDEASIPVDNVFSSTGGKNGQKPGAATGDLLITDAKNLDQIVKKKMSFKNDYFCYKNCLKNILIK